MSTGNLSIEAQTRYGFIRSLLMERLPPPAKVVELGSAPGDQIAALAHAGYEATSVDLGETADAWGSGEDGRMRRLLKDAGVEDILWNLEQQPYPLDDDTFDAVIMTEVYEHLRDYPVRSLEEVQRILKPGGHLFFTTPNVAYIVNRAKAVAGRNVMSSLPDWIGGVPHARHAREYTFAEAHELMRHAGLDVELSTSRHFHLDSGRQSPTGRLTKRALHGLAQRRPTLGPAIVIIARKPLYG